MSDAAVEKKEKVEIRLHQAFEVGVILKGLNAFLEVVLGIALLLPIADKISEFVGVLAQNELIEDPNDFLALQVQHVVNLFSPQAQFFGSMYLLSHGIVKLLLVWGLLRNKLWAYPASIVVLLLFILYQVVRFMSTHSIALVLLTIFDIVVLWLIWHEYRRVSAAAAKPEV